MAFVGIASAALAWAGIQELRGLSLLDPSRIPSTAELDQWQLAVAKGNELHLGTFIAAAIALLAWLSRVVDNTPGTGRRRPERIAARIDHLVVRADRQPVQAVPDRGRRLATPGDQRRRGRTTILQAWWILWVVGGVLDYLILWLPAPTNLADARLELEADAVAIGLQAVAGILLVIIIRETERRAIVRQEILEGPNPHEIDQLYASPEPLARPQPARA